MAVAEVGNSVAEVGNSVEVARIEAAVAEVGNSVEEARTRGWRGAADVVATARPSHDGPMTSAETVVSVRDLRKTYGVFTALDGVSFDIHRGETFALLGPNGAGKSTTIEILEGYRDRSSGDATVLGVDPQRGGLAWKARLGVVLQSTGESGTATVREQISHFAGFYAAPRDVDDLIAAVGLESKATMQIRKLSGGQRRRVDVALGIVGNPELLFLDEPTTGFDPEARRQFWELIRGLQSGGTTILLTTHYLDEAAQLADRVGVIAGGTLIDMGRVDEIGGAEARVPIVRWTDDDGVHEHRSPEPARFVSRLVEEAGGREPGGVQIIRPSLEDVYLHLVAESERERSAGTTGAASGATSASATGAASAETSGAASGATSAKTSGTTSASTTGAASAGASAETSGATSDREGTAA